MKPDNQALQVFYGTVPLIAVLVGVRFREQMLWKDTLVRLGRIEEFLVKAEPTAGSPGSTGWHHHNS